MVVPFVLAMALGLYIVPRMMLSTHPGRRALFGYVKTKSGGKSALEKYIGGVSFVPIVFITIGLTLVFNIRFLTSVNDEIYSYQLMRLMQLLAGMSLLYLISLRHDLQGTSGLNRGVGIFMAASLYPLSGFWIKNLHGFMGQYALDAIIGMPLTMLLVITFVMVVHLLDGINGLASMLCAFSLAILVGLTGITQQYVPCVVACAGLGVTFPYWLRHQVFLRQSRAYIGSCGTLPIGYLISFIIVEICRISPEEGFPDGLLLLAISPMLMPIFDETRVLISRLRDKRPLMLPDRNQLYHKLLRTGLNKWGIAIATILSHLLFVLLNIICVLNNIPQPLIIIGDAVFYVLLHLGINYFIFRQVNNEYGANWEKRYGNAAWGDVQIDIVDDDTTMKEGARAILEDTERQKELIQGEPLDMKDIAFITDGMNPIGRVCQYIFDTITSAILLIVFAPLMIVCAVLIYLEDGGPVLFRQQRIGRFGRPFYIHKFRSMRTDAEARGPQLSTTGKRDPRLTRIGAFLRRHHLDELPQLWDVMVGNMAFIGYRPERKYFIDQITSFDPRYYMLYQIRPGVTSYATLYNGYTDTMEKMLRRLELDLYYLRRRSWWFNIRILWLTFLNIARGNKF